MFKVPIYPKLFGNTCWVTTTRGCGYWALPWPGGGGGGALTWPWPGLAPPPPGHGNAQ